MLTALTGLVLCQFAGEVIARGLGLPLPGPVVGMVLLLALLVWRERRGLVAVPASLRSVTAVLLGNLSLLFVPAGVGVVTQLDVLRANWLAVAVSILASTAIGLLVTGWVMQALAAPDTADAPE